MLLLLFAPSGDAPPAPTITAPGRFASTFRAFSTRFVQPFVR